MVNDLKFKGLAHLKNQQVFRYCTNRIQLLYEAIIVYYYWDAHILHLGILLLIILP